MTLEDMDVSCSNPECGRPIVGTVVIVNDPMSSIDWEGLGIENVLTGQDDSGEEIQSLTLHQTCFTEMLNEIEKGEHMVVLTVAMGPVGEVKAVLAGED